MYYILYIVHDIITFPFFLKNHFHSSFFTIHCNVTKSLYFFVKNYLQTEKVCYTKISNDSYYCFGGESMKTVQKHSKKRDAILQVIRSTDSHPSAEWIYSQVKPIYPDISLGTVYRNLALFEETGEVIAVATVDGQKRYDATADPHTHFICECCNSVIDVETPQPFAEMYKALRQVHGLEANHHSLTFYGKCDKCQNGKN